jgi:uncharacterized membrane protein YhaH (DUF805 family)
MGTIDAGKLWQNFMDTVTNHYMDFSGRVARARFWFFILVCAVLGIAVAIVSSIVHLWILGPIFNLALLLPVSGMAARRIQDAGQNGQFVWAYVIVAAISAVVSILTFASGPLGAVGFFYFFISFGWIITLVEIVVGLAMLYFCVQPGTPGDNAFGPPPPPWTPAAGTP